MYSMKKTHPALIALVAALTLAACADTGEPSDPDSTGTDGSPSPQSTKEVQELPNGQVAVDESGLEDLPSVKGFDEDEISAAVDAAKDFALAGLTETMFYTGEWQDTMITSIAEDIFGPHSTNGVINSISSLDVEFPEEANVLASIAPIFRQYDDNIIPPPECEDNWEFCLREDITFSDLEGDVDKKKESNDDRLQISFKVDTSRFALYKEDHYAHSDINYENRFWMIEKDGEWLVDAFSNSYEFGEVITPAVEEASGKESEDD